MANLLEALTERGLVLWRLHHGHTRFRSCLVMPHRGRLALTVYDPTTRRPLTAEIHADIVTLVRWAEALRKTFLANEWREIDRDADRQAHHRRRASSGH